MATILLMKSYHAISDSLGWFDLLILTCSLIRTFETMSRNYFRSKKLKFIWLFARLFVPLHPLNPFWWVQSIFWRGARVVEEARLESV